MLMMMMMLMVVVIVHQNETVAGVDADGIKSKLRRIVNAVNVDDMSRALTEFESTATFTGNIRLVNWFSNVWKPHLMASLVLLVSLSCEFCHSSITVIARDNLG